MSFLTKRSGGNQALTLNPPIGLDLHITSHGSDWYWAVFCLFAFTALFGVVFSKLLYKNGSRFFHYNYVASSFVLAIAYYTMASDLGWTGIQAEFNHNTADDSFVTPGIRQIFYTRYIGWFLAFPPLIANLAVLSSLTISVSFFTVLTLEVFVVSFLIGSLIRSTYKWGYFVFGLVSLFFTAYHLVISFRRSSSENVSHITGAVSTVTISACALAGLLFLYPISWGLSEGGNVISNDSEAVFYGVLDVCVFIIIPTFFIIRTKNIDSDQLGVSNFNRPLFHNNREIGEKQARYSGDTAVTNFASDPAAPVIPQPEPVAVNPANAV